MNVKISNKLAALGMALMINVCILGGIAYLFNAQPLLHPSVPALAIASRGVEGVLLD